MLLLVFFHGIIKMNLYIQFFCFMYYNNSVLHALSALAPYGYEMVPSCISYLLSLPAFNGILLTFSVNTFCVWLPNLYCDFIIVSFFSRHFSTHNLISWFMTPFFVRKLYISGLNTINSFIVLSANASFIGLITILYFYMGSSRFIISCKISTNFSRFEVEYWSYSYLCSKILSFLLTFA